MKTIPVLLLLACSLYACNSNDHTAAGDKKTPVPADHFVTIDGYDFTDTTTSLYLQYADKDIVRLNCTTNLPVNTRLVIQKGLRVNQTSAGAEQNRLADTITVTGAAFTVPFSPKLMGGYVNFSVWPEIQPETLRNEFTKRDAVRADLAYYTEYTIDYKKSTPAGSSVPVPDVPVKLVITK